jgi:hypothetical protein
MIEFQAQDVSYSQDLEFREYFQVLFQEKDEPGVKYVLLQRQFEIPDGGACYFECDEIEHSGSYVIRNSKLSRDRFEIQIPGDDGGKWGVTFELDEGRYEELKEVLSIILQKPSRMVIET